MKESSSREVETSDRGGRETLRGGEWLLTESSPASIFRPERLSDEHRLIARTVNDFVNAELLPSVAQLETGDWALSRELLRKAGALGLLGADAPEAYGGAQLDKVGSLLIADHIAAVGSFSATYGAQTNLTALPLSLFGTDDQKRRYLARVLAGDLVGAYCLSEPGSGSDALGARVRADRQADGSYVLNGEKAWTTNGGFADLYVVFAKVDGEHFSAFLVERAWEGVSIGAEEHKMGLHGSSTTPVVFQHVRVPAHALLGEVGRGHKIAFNVLNLARFKLGGMCIGGARRSIESAAQYAATRKQFGSPIAAFGAIKHKLGEMVARTYALESFNYRVAGLIDQRLGTSSTPHDPSALLAAFEEYAAEASMAKVAGSETLDFVLDETIQIHGGNGFVRDYPAERHYRDSRVNRIFEGTNEINRLLIPGLLIKRAAKGSLGLIAAARALQDELLSPPTLTSGASDDPYSDLRGAVAGCKRATLMVAGLAMQTYREHVGDEQEVLMQLADMMIDTAASESATLRAAAVTEDHVPHAAWHAAAARVFVADAALRVEMAARQSLPTVVQGDTLRVALAGLRRFFKQAPVDTVALRRELAAAIVERGQWIFDAGSTTRGSTSQR